ncbi:butyrate kinase [Desulfitobacterium chlororespirans]|uniref:Probable butyrate kinase n=1 Tax=Desulfitobacterium chlororespirans DSM 11544 TaxID=1121395 RepID=A0A1M7SXW1_9FIRM|nr:butyrate kinase [Desulfitobacterium chlororespirans]SHN63312.1 butyrate kinase [Desulfitobacterium chlororespirans DSM 11544]
MSKQNTFILAINPGSTSTKVAVFENETKIFSRTIVHAAEDLQDFPEIPDQLGYRKTMILQALREGGIALEQITAFVGRGGGLNPCQGGTYLVQGLLLEHARTCHTARHPAALGAVLAHELAGEYGKKAYIVDPPDVDEFEPVARITGLKTVCRQSRFHALNQKEVGRRAAADLGKAYEEINLVIVHMGGGISVTAHKQGKAVDSTDTINGDGPMAPTRAGQLPAADLAALCYSGRYTEREIGQLIVKNGGLVDHLGTSDVLEVKERIQQEDARAALIYEALAYQIGKAVGAYAAVLHGEVAAVVLTGGIARDQDLVGRISEMVRYIGPVMVYPGEFEMEALANGVLRVLAGQEQAKEYDGIPPWNGFKVQEESL